MYPNQDDVMRGVVNALIVSVESDLNTPSSLWFYRNSSPEQEFYEQLSLVTDAEVPIVPGFWDWLRAKYLKVRDLYFEEEIPSLLISALNPMWTISTDIVHVASSFCTTLGYLPAQRTEKDIMTSTLHWMMWASIGKWVSVLKYHKDYLFVRYAPLVLREYPELPCEIPRPGYFLCGSFNRFILRKLRSKDLIVLNSVLQGLKKGFMPVDIPTVLKAATKHADVLREYHATDPIILDEVERTSREVFGTCYLESLKIKNNETLSSHSCYESTRSTMGFNGRWLRETYVHTFKSQGPAFEVSTSKIDPVMYWMGLAIHGRTDLSGFLLDRTRVIGELRCPVELVSDSFADLLRHCLYRDVPDSVKVKFILEPLKVRTISCNSYDTAAVLIPFQRFLWRKMQSQGIFQLTGEPESASILQKIVAGRWAHNEVMCSGDYSQATDNLHMDATIRALQACCGSAQLLRIALLALGPQKLEYYGKKWSCLGTIVNPEDYPFYEEDLPEPYWQQNGQLMGSPLSFPFLCILNAAIFRHAWEQFYSVEVSLKDLRVLINGDDIAFRCEKEFYPFWRQEIQRIGFKPSVGKNFVSRDFVNINSAYFVIKQEDGIHWVDRQLPYVNMGLIMGRGKGDSDGELGLSGKMEKFFSYLSAGRDQVISMTNDLPEGIKQATYAAWKSEREKLVCEEFPVGFCAGGLATEEGPQTVLEARTSTFISKYVQWKPFTDPIFGPKDSANASYWKAYNFAPDSNWVEICLRQAVRRARTRSIRHYARWNTPIEESITCDFAHWGAGWGLLRSRALMDVSCCN